MPAEEYWKQNINWVCLKIRIRYCDENRAKTEIFTDANRKEARAIAAESFVLLKNQGQCIAIKKIRNNRIDWAIGRC